MEIGGNVDLNVKDCNQGPVRIYRNSGCESIESAEYEESSYVPKRDWKEISTEEYRASLELKGENILYFFSLEKNEFEFYTQAKFHDKIKDQLMANQDPEIGKLVDQLKRFTLRKFDLNEEEVQELGVKCAQKGQQTLTRNKNSNKYIGLHFDSWETREVAQRKNSKWRVCYNIGTSYRSIYLVNSTAEKIHGELLERVDEEITGVSNFMFHYFKHYASNPIYRFDVPPKTAYLVPTDNLIHDGSTKYSESVDLNVSFRIPMSTEKIKGISAWQISNSNR